MPASFTIQRLPTGDYSVTDWLKEPSDAANCYSLVDDPVATPDDNTTYIYSNTLGSITALFSYSAFSVPTNAIDISLDIKIRAKKTASDTAATLNSAIRISSTNYNKTASSLTTSFGNYTFTYATDPSTSAAWTPSGINGVSYFGIVGILGSGGKGGPVITRVYAEVTYKTNQPYACAGPGIVIGSVSTTVG